MTDDTSWAATPALAPPGARAGLGRRLGVRFLLTYLVLYDTCLICAWSYARFGGIGWTQLAGDGWSDHVWMGSLAVLAAVVAAAWVAAEARAARAPRPVLVSDGRNPEDAENAEPVLAEALQLIARWSLGGILMAHGIRVALQLESPPPSLGVLSSPIGASSPLVLYQTFMGASRLFPALTGGLEALACVLLWFRRTATLGAVLAFGLAGNALMLAVSYGAPHKLAALHLLLMASIVLAPHTRRLRDGLLFGRATQPIALPRSDDAQTERRRRATAVLQVGALVALTAVALQSVLPLHRAMPAPRPPIYGVYAVESFNRDGRDVPLLPYDPARWHEVVIETAAAFEVRRLDGSVERYRARYGTSEVLLDGGAEGVATGGRGVHGALVWSKQPPGTLSLRGTLGGEILQVGLRRVDRNYLLTATPFRLIIDDAVNR